MLQTARLELKKISIADAPFILALFNSPGWKQYIGDRNVHTHEEAADYIKKTYLPHFETHGFGTYICVLTASNQPIGSCGLYQRENLDHADIGFAFLPEFFGKGYAFEAASAMMAHARITLKMDTILGFTTKQNTASIALLQKIGLTENGGYFYEDDQEELLLFST